MGNESNGVSEQLSHWFRSVQQLTEAGVFGIVADRPHHNAIVLDTMRRHAKNIYQAKLDADSGLYQPLCFFLAAACQFLQASLGVGHWRAAVDNVRDLQKRLASYRSEAIGVGLELGSPAAFFKGEFDEAVRQAGLLDDTSFLSKDDRQVALGLAINWGIRLLLAYAAETTRLDRTSDRKDLAWLGGRIGEAAAGDGD